MRHETESLLRDELSGHAANAVGLVLDVYYVNSLPSQLQGGDVVLVCAAALVLSFLATLYPSWRASRIEPAEALRYE